jgi:iron-sulfur cluster repair protein YtfE (RIC family)
VRSQEDLEEWVLNHTLEEEYENPLAANLSRSMDHQFCCGPVRMINNFTRNSQLVLNSAIGDKPKFVCIILI